MEARERKGKLVQKLIIAAVAAIVGVSIVLVIISALSINNTYDDNVGDGVTTFTTYCNDAGGYVVYAIGSSGNVEGNTNLIGDTGANIATGIMTSGNT